MVFKCDELPGREFKTRDEMFLELKRFESRLISMKLAQVYKSCEKHQLSFLNLDMAKVSGGTGKVSFAMKQGFIYPVVSTTRFRDSHKDVHFDGCFTDTIKSEQGNVCYALDHQLKYRDILAWQKDVMMFSAMIDWPLVGKSYPGQTQGLVFEIPEEKIRDQAILADIKNMVADFENSIRMIYRKVILGINSNQKDLAENKAYYDSRIGEIANSDEVAQDGYFWGVEKLDIYKEASLVVAGGSNSATRIMIPEVETAAGSELLLSSQKSVWDYYLN